MTAKLKLLVFLSAYLLIFPTFEPNYLFAQEEEDECETVERRMAWFHTQRMHPDTLLPTGYPNALDEKMDLISNNGYALSGPGLSWQNIGPQPLGGIGGIVTGRVCALIYDKRDNTGSTIYIAPAGGGVWKTTNGGANWTNISGNLPLLVSGAIAIDFDNDIIYYGSGTNHIFGSEFQGMGMFKTTDESNWTRISSGLPDQTQIFKIAIDPNDANTIFIAEFHGLFKSTDAGTSWNKIQPTSGDRLCTDVCFSPDGSKVYAIGSSTDYWVGSWFQGIGFWKSTDGGDNFSAVPQSSGFPRTVGMSYRPYVRSHLAVSEADNDLLYLVSWEDQSGTENYVYKSTNAGVNFSVTNGGSPVYTTGGNSGFNMMIRCSDYDPDICFVGFQDLLRTTNGGNSWTAIGGYVTGHNPHADFHTLDFNHTDANSEKIFVGGDGGVSRSENTGTNWTNVNQDLSLSQVWFVGSNTYNSAVISAGLQDQGIAYKYDGNYWLNDWACDGGLVLPSPFKTGRTIGGIAACRTILYSTNGTTFTEASNYLQSDPTIGGAWIAVAAHHPSDPGTTYLVRFGNQESNGGYYTPIKFLKSTNYGASYDGSGSHVSFTNPWPLVSPNSLSISQSNPEMMIMAIGNGSAFWQTTNSLYSRLIKSTNGGLNWNTGSPLLVCDNSNVVPNRYLTKVVIDPVNENEIYVTMSGYGTGHVYRTTNGGTNWLSIDGSSTTRLPDVPVNDLIIHYTSSNTKEIIVATDVGIFRSDAGTIAWSVLAEGLPNSPVMNLDYNRLSGKLNCATLGRSVWQLQLPGPIYVQDKLYITDNVTLDQSIVVADNGTLIIGHSTVNSSMSVTFNNGADIVVENGGTLLANSNIPITFNSSGTWDGIAVNGNSSNCVLKNITFSNTGTPVVINEGLSFGVPSPTEGIMIYDCHFTNVPIEVTGRDDVHIEYCDWAMSSGTDAIIASSSDNIYLSYNDIIYSAQVDNSNPIQLSLCDNATVTRSTITGADYPITISNGTSYVRYSNITTSDADESYTGISLINVSDGHMIANNVSGYQTGYELILSSPNLLLNDADGSNSNGLKTAIVCDGSSPVMFPTVTESEVVWDGGLNTLRNDASSGIGMFNTEGEPQLDYGYNLIVGDVNIDGDYPKSSWDVHCNSWENDPPVFSVTGVTMNYSPTDCTPPDSRPFNSGEGKGGSQKEDEFYISDVIPPQPFIVNYGNGLIDTLEVSSVSIEVTADIELFGNGIREIYLGNFEDALNIFEDVVSTYQDSAVAMASLNRIFYCHNRMNSDSSEYNSLRTYYLGLASTYNTDTAFSKVASELSRKCLVKQKNYISAIGEYEDVVENSNDSTEILVAEISIIELYIVLNTIEGDAIGYTGRLSNLKPSSLRDGMKKIREKMGRKQSGIIVSIPKQFNLSQNYPNPFNPLTKINYSLPNSTKVTIKVYDLLGKLVNTLVNEFKDAGNYTINFDGSNLASGVYFYKIEAGDFVASKKMVLVK